MNFIRVQNLSSNYDKDIILNLDQVVYLSMDKRFDGSHAILINGKSSQYTLQVSAEDFQRILNAISVK